MSPALEAFLNPILPVSAILILGFIFGRAGTFTAAEATPINRFVFYLAVPALLFNIMADAPLETFDWALLLAYFISECGIYAGAAAIARFVFKRGPRESLLLGMAACFSNHVFFVLPMARILYGDQAALPIGAIIVVDSIGLFGFTMAGLEIASNTGRSLARIPLVLARNPVLAAMALGLAVNIAGIPVHDGIRTFTNFTGASAAPVALFALGVILSNAGIGRLDGAALMAAASKVILHPLLGYTLFMNVFDIEPAWSEPALLVTAGPCGAMPFVLALQYGVKSEGVAKAMIYSSVASLAVMSIIA
ncbi:MAG: AEC family transporter [Rhodobiaceae bacterium]|nr:AEC family transporter [Rhodobiaceae bacterium]